MRHFFIYAIAAIFIFLCIRPCLAAANTPLVIRVGLTGKGANSKSVWVSGKSNLRIEASNVKNLCTVTPEDTEYLITTTSGGIYVGKTDGPIKYMGAFVTIKSTVVSNPIQLKYKDGSIRKYLGALEVSAVNGFLVLVNCIEIESYLRGVLANEMQSKSPSDALKAQAICARTYAHNNIGRHKNSGYHLCDSIHCQLYTGVTAHTPTTDAAITQTAGQVLFYNGELARVMYSSDSGGVTQDYQEMYDVSAFPYLKSVKDPEGIARRNWSISYQIEDIAKKLVASGVKTAKDMSSIAIQRKGTGDRVLSVSIVSPTGTTELGADKLRSALGVNELKSTLFTIDTPDAKKILFTGKGYGHGIGLCQTGARALAAPPFNYTHQQILSHYFPGTIIANTDRSITNTASRSKTK